MNNPRKRLSGVLSALLLASLLLPLASCSLGGKIVELDKVWQAGDPAIAHPVGRAAEDGGWIADVADGYDAMMQWNLQLKPGSYVCKADLMTDTQNVDPVLLAELRLSPAGEPDRLVSGLGAYSSEFSQQLTYRLYEMPFVIEAEGTYTFRIVSRAKGYVRVGQVAVQTVAAGTYARRPIDDLMEVPQDEAGLVYDDRVLYKFDLRAFARELTDYRLQYDLYAMVTTLQGLANADEPHLFVIGTGKYQKDTHNSLDIDQYWFDFLDGRADSPWQGRKVVEIRHPLTVLGLFKDRLNGVVAWDWSVPATVNVAFTAAGVEKLLPLCYSEEVGSLYRYLVLDRHILPTPLLNLQGKFTGQGTIWGTARKSSGSAKNDAYRFAVDRYLKTGKTDPRWISCYIDAFLSHDGLFPSLNVIPSHQQIERAEIVNRDYFIGKKAFFFDLDVWTDSFPTDDPDQYEGTDLETLREILEACNVRAGGDIIHCGGFFPWQSKYTSSAPYADAGSHGDVESEWEFIRIMSYYNVVTEADAISDVANASVYRHFETKEQYVNPNRKAADFDMCQTPPAQKNYLLFYMGDYDSPAWMIRNMDSIWSDVNRGKLPLAWPIIPVLEGRAGFIMDHMYETATGNDYFVGGDNGYGYLNPFHLYQTESDRGGLKGSFASFVALTKEAYRRWDIDLQGLLIRNGLESNKTIDAVYQAYADDLGVRGIVANFAIDERQIAAQDGRKVPLSGYFDVGVGFWGNAAQTAAQIVGGRARSREEFAAHPEQRGTFTVLRSIISTPTQALAFFDNLKAQFPGYDFEVLDPYTFLSYYNSTLTAGRAGA